MTKILSGQPLQDKLIIKSYPDKNNSLIRIMEIEINMKAPKYHGRITFK